MSSFPLVEMLSLSRVKEWSVLRIHSVILEDFGFLVHYMFFDSCYKRFASLAYILGITIVEFNLIHDTFLDRRGFCLYFY